MNLLSKKQAAAFLQVAPSTLDRWRSEGRGPRVLYVGGRVRYKQEDLEDWIEENNQKRKWWRR